MSLDYTFYLQVSEPPEAVRRQVLDFLTSVGLSPETRDGIGSAALHTASIDYQPTRDMFADSFGFVPNVCVTATVDKAAPWPESQAQGVAVLRAILCAYNGPLYGEYAGVQPVVLRRQQGGTLEIDTEWLGNRDWATRLIPGAFTEVAVPQPA